MADVFTSGNSSVEVERTSKGQYTWSVKLYFDRNDKRTINGIIDRVNHARARLEELLGQVVAGPEGSVQVGVDQAVASASGGAPKPSKTK